jgi:hypothetical protein
VSTSGVRTKLPLGHQPRTWCDICGRASTHLNLYERVAKGWMVDILGRDVCPRCPAPAS